MTSEIAQQRFDAGNAFTEKYFLEEVTRFRTECGLKTFWARTDDQQTNMIAGLTFVYLNIVNDDGTQPNKEQLDRWHQIFHAAIENYNTRKTMLVMLPLKRHLGL